MTDVIYSNLHVDIWLSCNMVYLDRIELLCAELNKPYYGAALDGKIF